MSFDAKVPSFLSPPELDFSQGEEVLVELLVLLESSVYGQMYLANLVFSEGRPARRVRLRNMERGATARSGDLF